MLHHLQHNRINLIYHNDNATKQELFLCVRITSQSQSFGLTTILILQQSCLVRDSSRKPLFNFNSKRQLERNLWCDCNTWIQIQMSYYAPDKTEMCCTLYDRCRCCSVFCVMGDLYLQRLLTIELLVM